MMQSMRNGIEKHFVRQLELLLDGWMDGSMHISNAPSTFPFPFPFQIFCCALHANWVISYAPYSFVYHHISYHILSFIFLETFSTFQHICVWFFFSFFSFSKFSYVLPKLFLFSIFTPHTLGEPNSLQSVWQAEGTQRWHRHARRQRSMRHRMMRMWSAIAVRMWSQIAGFEKTRRH